MSNDYIIPDKEVAISDSTSIKSNVDSELSSLENGDIVTCQYLLEEIKKIQSKFTGIYSNIAYMNAGIAKNTTDISSAKNDIITNTNNIDALTTRVTALENKS